MSLLVVGTVAFDAIETPFGKTDKIVGGAASYIALAASYFHNDISLVSVVVSQNDTNQGHHFQGTSRNGHSLGHHSRQCGCID